MMENNIIQKLIDEKKYFEIRKYLNDLNIVEVSELLNQFESSELIMIFRLLSKNRAADVFSYLESEHQEMIIKTMTDVETKNIFGRYCRYYRGDAIKCGQKDTKEY